MPGDTWRKSLLPPGATFQDAIRSLVETGLQIVLVVSEGGVLLGTVTDGDIRRGLLRGLTLTSPIDEIIYRDPLVVTPEMGRELVLQLMTANRIHQMPVVDGGRRVVGLQLWDKLTAPGERSNLLVIMAGGRGTRLGSQTERCPKPLLPVRDKPMIEHIILRAKSAGFRRFVLAIHYLGHMIEEYCGNGEKWQVDIQYLREESPLGTAGALSLLEPRPDAPIVVTNGDVLTDVRFDEILDFHTRHGASATMAVRLHEWEHPFGVVRIRGVDIIGFEERPILRSHINAGIYVIEPDALDILAPNEPCDMPTLFTRLMERDASTIVYPMHEPWLDVGRPADLQTARGEL